MKTEQRNLPPEKKPQKIKINRFFIKAALKFSLFTIVIGLIAAVFGAIYFSRNLPDLGRLAQDIKTPTITILAEDGSILTKSGNLYGDYISYDEAPPHLIAAVLATEDRRFFSHLGVDPFGIMRAAITNYRAGRLVQGGSTITQQLAKIAFLTPEKSLDRKIQEMMLAFIMERHFTKQQILTMYINRVYLGAGIYGVDAAAKYYFGKNVNDINIQEAAIMAGLLKAPSRFSPLANPELANARMQQVLVNMEDAGYITKEQLEIARQQQLNLNTAQRGVLKNQYFADWVMSQLPDYIGSIDQNLTVATTLNPLLQQYAENSVKKIMDANAEKKNASESAMIAMDKTGAVKAMVGGRDYGKSQFNRTLAKRQAGSVFKLFVYLNAFEHGASPDDTELDEPVTLIVNKKEWSPENYTKKYQGEVTIRDAFAESLNTISVRLAEKYGFVNIVRIARKLGVTSELDPHPSIALGTPDISLYELAQAFAHIANDGKTVIAHAITEIKDEKGVILYQREISEPSQVISKKTVLNMNDVMTASIKYGTSQAANIGRPTAGKTGTGQDYRNAWFIGFSSGIIAGTWVGNDDNSPMKKVTGGGLPAQIWKEFMMQALKSIPIEELPTTFAPGENIEDMPWLNEMGELPWQKENGGPMKDELEELLSPNN